MGNESSEKKVNIWSPTSIFVTKATFKQVSSEFQPFHQHDLNVFLHVLTTGVGLWGAIQLAHTYSLDVLIWVYGVGVLLSAPLKIGMIHSAMIAGMMMVESSSWKECATAIVLGYGLQDLAHYLTVEKTYMGSYIFSRPALLLLHNFFLMPLVIEGVLARNCFLPWFVHRDRTVFTTVKSLDAVEDLRTWTKENVPETPETTHVWPHKQEETTHAAKALENDQYIMDAFRTVFAERHFDIDPIVGMNEIYVTAVGAKKAINSDAVFYTPHVDGPYWWLPGASVYRLLVGLTPNKKVRTRFNLQYVSKDTIVNKNQVLGFDYNRELHWIDHTGLNNEERRSVLKLHYVVYPRGWKYYGKFVAYLNTSYNTWARNNFLRTLRPNSVFARVNAWWIWLTTFFNAKFEEALGWNNLVYLALAYSFGPTAFFIFTSYRHYIHYITTYAFKKPPVAFGVFVRDARIYKTIALIHLFKFLIPHVVLSRDLPVIVAMVAGFSITILATVQIGIVRTYFGSELGFVKPQWVDAFPYGVVPHPMIVGQLFALGSALLWWREVLTPFESAAILAHMGFYTTHMMQEILDSSYS